MLLRLSGVLTVNHNIFASLKFRELVTKDHIA